MRFILLLSLLLSQVALANNAFTLSEEDKRLIEAGRQILERSAVAQSGPFPDEQASKPVQNGWFLFASTSLGDKALSRIFAEASQTGATVLFRGIPEGQSLGAAMRRLQALMKDLEPLPLVAIDPQAFVHWRVTGVPALFFIEQGKVTASVLGVYSKDWLQSAIARGQTGDLGQRGPIAGIAEPDLLRVMQKRLLALDLNALKQKALERFWQRQSFVALTPAKTAQVRFVDPTTVLSAPLKNAQGQVILPAGTRINPLKALPFTQQLVVFDGTRREEVDAVAQWLSRQDRTAKRLTLITTQLDPIQGWSALAKLEVKVDQPVYLLNPTIQSRFDLKVTPSFVDAEGEFFRIEELPVEVLAHE